MRGRTNIGGGGIAINATVEQKTIKSGNIIAGDFVEYYTEPSYIEQGERVYFQFNIGDYAVARKGDAVIIFKNNQQVSVYNGHVIKKIRKYNNFILFIARITNPNTRYAFGVLKIQNDTLVLCDVYNSQDIIPNDYQGTESAGVTVGEGKLVAINRGPSNNFYLQHILVCDISSEGLLSNPVETNVSSLRITSSSRIDIFYNNGYFRAFAPNGSNIFDVAVNSNDNSATVSIHCTKSTSGFVSISGWDYICGQFGDIVIFPIYESNSILGTINMSSGATSIIRGISVGHVAGNISQNRFVTTKYSNDNTGLEINLYSYNPENNNISFLDTITIPLIAGRTTNDSVFSCLNEDTGFVYSGPSVSEQSGTTYIDFYDVYLAKVKNHNVLEEFGDEQYVKPYTGDGNPIGVAKDSGTAGDTIDVYIPAVSS